MKTLFLGLGNDILGNDGVGIKVMRELKRRRPEIEVKEICAAGFRVVDELLGYKKIVLIDAIKTAQGKPGTVYFFTAEDFSRNTLHLSSSHDVDLFSALKIMEDHGEEVPHEIVIYAIEVEETYTFSQECTMRVSEAIPAVVDRLIREQLTS